MYSPVDVHASHFFPSISNYFAMPVKKINVMNNMLF
jgi:hypothetical protein